MKFYRTSSAAEDFETAEVTKYNEYTTSAGAASKVRTRLKKLGHTDIATKEVDVPTARSELVAFLNVACACLDVIV